MRLLIALVASLAFAAACGGDDSSTSTPSAIVSVTPTDEPPNASGAATVNADACTPDDVTGTFVKSEGAAGHVFLTLEVGQASRMCTFPGPPELRWYDASGVALGVPFTPGESCASGATDFVVCIFPDAVEMTGGKKVQAIVSVANTDLLPPCASPTLAAHIVGLQFPDTPKDVQITLPKDVTLQTCSAQVGLTGYGPAS